MSWLLVVAVVLVLASLAFPVQRRLWVFHLYACKYLLLWLADAVGVRRLLARLAGRACEPYSRPVLLRRFCEDMGPTFIKFGQIVASSSGMFPRRYVQEFQKCLDRVRPFPFSQVQETLAADLGAERAARLVDVSPTPLASASIAQVHAARLDGGGEVVVKVQRPGIDRRIAADMRIMRLVARVVEKTVRDAELANPVGIVEDFAKTLTEELDFRLEAKNLDAFNDIMGTLGHQDVHAPKPSWELTTRRVLVMERFFGVRIDDVETIRARQIDAEANLIKGMRAWFQSVIFHGFFHGDVHAGNLMLLDNGHIGFLDFGIVGRFDERQREMVTEYIVAFAGGDYRALAAAITEMGGVSSHVDSQALARDLEATYSPLLKMSFRDINYGELLPQVQRVASRHRMRMPREFVLITKQMLYFDRYAKLLAPKLSVFTDPRLVMSLAADVAKLRAMKTARAGA